MTPQPDRSASVRRTLTSSLLNLFSAVMAPFAAGFWFSGSWWAFGWLTEGGTFERGCLVAAGVATAWSAFGSADANGSAGALWRGFAIGAASVGAAAGLATAASLGVGFTLIGGFAICSVLTGSGSMSDMPPFFPLYGPAIIFAGFWIAGRLWWLASRAPRSPRRIGLLGVEAAAACLAACWIVGMLGGPEPRDSVLEPLVALYVCAGLVRSAFSEPPPPRQPSGV